MLRTIRGWKARILFIKLPNFYVSMSTHWGDMEVFRVSLLVRDVVNLLCRQLNLAAFTQHVLQKRQSTLKAFINCPFSVVFCFGGLSHYTYKRYLYLQCWTWWSCSSSDRIWTVRKITIEFKSNWWWWSILKWKTFDTESRPKLARS